MRIITYHKSTFEYVGRFLLKKSEEEFGTIIICLVNLIASNEILC